MKKLFFYATTVLLTATTACNNEKKDGTDSTADRPEQTSDVAGYDDIKIAVIKENALDTTAWRVMGLPLGDGKEYLFKEPNAIITAIEDGGIELRVNKYTLKGLPNNQATDTGKEFYMTKQEIKLPQSGSVTFSVDMAAETLGLNGQDYQDAFAIFNLIDLSTGVVFDGYSTGKRMGSIYERLEIAGAATPVESFTYFVEAPLITAPKPLEWNKHSIVIDVDNKTAVWLVNGKKIYEVPKLGVVPKSVTMGFGLFTFKPYQNGESVSISGQGMLGQWKNFEVTYN